MPIGNTLGTLVPATYDDLDGNFLVFVGDIPGMGDLYDLNYFSTNYHERLRLTDLEKLPDPLPLHLGGRLQVFD